jgi:hypothetical protein
MTEPSGLEGRFAALEQQVRSLMATNWTDRASVVNAAGAAVPLSAYGVALVEAGEEVTGAVRQAARLRSQQTPGPDHAAPEG